MKTRMKLRYALPGAVGVICTILTFPIPASAQCPKSTNSSLNLKTFGCESTIDSVTLSGGVLTGIGHLKVANSGKGPATISNIVANLQVRDGSDWITVAHAVVTTCGDGAAKTCSGTFTTTPGTHLSASVGLVVGPFAGVACGATNLVDIPYMVSFPASAANYQLDSGKPARIEFLVTYDRAVSGCPNNLCVAGSCGFNRDIVVRFSFPVP